MPTENRNLLVSLDTAHDIDWQADLCRECDAAVQAFITERRIAFWELRKRAGDAAGDKEGL